MTEMLMIRDTKFKMTVSNTFKNWKERSSASLLNQS